MQGAFLCPQSDFGDLYSMKEREEASVAVVRPRKKVQELTFLSSDGWLRS